MWMFGIAQLIDEYGVNTLTLEAYNDASEVCLEHNKEEHFRGVLER